MFPIFPKKSQSSVVPKSETILLANWFFAAMLVDRDEECLDMVFNDEEDNEDLFERLKEKYGKSFYKKFIEILIRETTLPEDEAGSVRGLLSWQFKELQKEVLDVVDREAFMQKIIGNKFIKKLREQMGLNKDGDEKKKTKIQSENPAKTKESKTGQEILTADYLKAAIILISQGKDEEGWKFFLEAANNPDFPKVNYDLGTAYVNGNGVTRNVNLGIHFLTHAATRNFVDAQYDLGVVYRDAHFGKQDNNKSFDWFEKAVKSGHLGAKWGLVLHYLDKSGPKRDRKKAFNLLEEMANQDIEDKQHFAMAQYHLALLLMEKEEREYDLVEAVYWMKMDISNGHQEAVAILKNLVTRNQELIGVPPEFNDRYVKLTEQEMATHSFKEFAKTLRTKSDNKDNEEETKDSPSAVELVRKAAEAGDGKAQYHLGLNYKSGIETKKDLNQALFWLKQASEQNLNEADFELAMFYDEDHEEIGRDRKEIVRLLEKSADNGFAFSQIQLAIFYQKGIGVEQNPKRAFELIKKAAEQDIPGAQYDLAICYKDGYGTEQDYKNARSWFIKAAKNGAPEARAELEKMFSPQKEVKDNEVMNNNMTSTSELPKAPPTKPKPLIKSPKMENVITENLNVDQGR